MTTVYYGDPPEPVDRTSAERWVNGNLGPPAAIGLFDFYPTAPRAFWIDLHSAAFFRGPHDVRILAYQAATRWREGGGDPDTGLPPFAWARNPEPTSPGTAPPRLALPGAAPPAASGATPGAGPAAGPPPNQAPPPGAAPPASTAAPGTAAPAASDGLLLLALGAAVWYGFHLEARSQPQARPSGSRRSSSSSSRRSSRRSSSAAGKGSAWRRIFGVS